MSEMTDISPGKILSAFDMFLYLKFTLKLKKVGKNNRLFRYDLNQSPYDYTVEVTDSRD